MANKYCDYFDINESYFPCIDESAINDGAPWDTTYPHETFIELLRTIEHMLGGNTNRSVWIHGAYGTGKSQCALAVRRILEVPEQELRDYWNKYEPLKKDQALLEKYVGHKEHGIVTAYRYASGSITTPQLLFLAIQESIKKALNEPRHCYKGENSLKGKVLSRGWKTPRITPLSIRCSKSPNGNRLFRSPRLTKSSTLCVKAAMLRSSWTTSSILLPRKA